MTIMKHFGSLQAISFFAVLFSLSEAFADNPHFTPMSLSPSSFASPSTVKTAGVYWMPDYIGRIGGYGYGNRTNDDELINGGKYASCANYGLAASCPPQQNGTVVHPTPELTCYKGCSCSDRYQYDASNCKPPSYPSGASCGGKYADCIINIPEACLGYTQTCPDGWQLEDGGRCKYDNTYGTCCNKCDGFEETEIKPGYIETSRCDSCFGIRYKTTVNPCDGYFDCQYGAVTGSAVCQSGDVVKYKECKKEPTVCPAESWNLESYWCNGALKCWIK